MSYVFDYIDQYGYQDSDEYEDFEQAWLTADCLAGNPRVLAVSDVYELADR